MQYRHVMQSRICYDGDASPHDSVINNSNEIRLFCALKKTVFSDSFTVNDNIWNGQMILLMTIFGQLIKFI